MSLSYFDPHDLPNGELKRAAESLHKMLTYRAFDVKKLENSLFYLATIMHVAENHILSREEERTFYEELKALEEEFHGGALLLSSIENTLKELVYHLCDNNAKAKIIYLLVELEHFLCIGCPKELEIPLEIFQKMAAPYFELMQKPLSTIETRKIHKNLEDIATFLRKEPHKTWEAKELFEKEQDF